VLEIHQSCPNVIYFTILASKLRCHHHFDGSGADRRGTIARATQSVQKNGPIKIYINAFHTDTLKCFIDNYELHVAGPNVFYAGGARGPTNGSYAPIQTWCRRRRVMTEGTYLAFSNESVPSESTGSGAWRCLDRMEAPCSNGQVSRYT
jgi:hypothetical protein